jgi:hypothetical protein
MQLVWFSFTSNIDLQAFIKFQTIDHMDKRWFYKEG